MGTYKTSNTRKKESTSKKTRTHSGKSSKRTSDRTSRRNSATKQRLKEVTEQISILEVINDGAVAAKPFALIFSALFCLYTGLALFSFEPLDLETLSTGNVQNLCGVFGVILSKTLFLFLGYGAWVVLPIGGLKEKLLAALRAGTKTVIIPKENEKDMADIPDNVKDNLELIFVDNVDEVLKIALTKPLLPIEWDESETPSKKGDLTEDDADMDADNPITH